MELTAAIAWENASSKFNRALRVPSQDLWLRTRSRLRHQRGRPHIRHDCRHGSKDHRRGLFGPFALRIPAKSAVGQSSYPFRTISLGTWGNRGKGEGRGS